MTKPKRQYKRYSSEFKREALLRASEEGYDGQGGLRRAGATAYLHFAKPQLPPSNAHGTKYAQERVTNHILRQAKHHRRIPVHRWATLALSMMAKNILGLHDRLLIHINPHRQRIGHYLGQFRNSKYQPAFLSTMNRRSINGRPITY